MIAEIAGSINSVELFKGGDHVLKCIIMGDDASIQDVTGDTVTFSVYDRSDRANAATATHSSVALTTPTSGFVTMTIQDSELTYGPGTYYGYLKWTHSGVALLSQPFVVTIK